MVDISSPDSLSLFPPLSPVSLGFDDIFQCIFFSVVEVDENRRKRFSFFSSFFVSLFLSICALPRCLLLCFEAGWPLREETPLQRRQPPRREEQRYLRGLVRAIPDRSPPQQRHRLRRERKSLPLLLLLRSASARSSPAWDRASTLRGSLSLARSFW